MIEVKGVSKTYGKKDSLFTALNDVRFTIPDGATVAIIGKSGSGKSTLMHIMSGLDHPNEGKIVIDGEVLHDKKGKAMDNFRAREMSFIFQAFFVEPNQTCYQNVALPLEIANISRKTKLIEDAMSAVDLSDKLNAKAANLSGGQKQRLAIARAIVHKPKLLFADEPTGNLDSATGDKIIDLLFSLNKKIGNTLIIVTHDPELAARCQVQITLKDGEVIAIRQGKVAKPSKTAKKAPVKRSKK